MRNKVLTDSQNMKCHYKMYKSGRKWMFCGIMLASMGAATLTGNLSVQAHADDIQQSEQAANQAGNSIPSPKSNQSESTEPSTVESKNPTGNTVTVDASNFESSFTVHDNATFGDPKSGTATLTENAGSKQGSITLNNKITLNQGFDMNGQINLGTLDQTNGAGGDGIAFGFHSANSDQIGKGGDGLGLGGIPDAIGWKADTTYNWTKTNQADIDPAQFSNTRQPNNPGWGNGQNFGAFIQSSKGTGDVTTTGVTQGSDSAQVIEKLNPVPTDQLFKDIAIKYRPDVKGQKLLTVIYDNKVWQKDITDWAADKTDTAFFVSAGTGSNANLQQFKLKSFTYQPAATVDVKYFYTTDQALIDNPQAKVDRATITEIPDFVGQVDYPNGAFMNNSYLTYPQSIAGYTFVRMAEGSLPQMATLTKPGNNGVVKYLYVKNGNGGQKASVEFWDMTENKQLGQTINLEGKSNTQAYYSDQPAINAYIKAGYDYNPQDDSIENGITFDADNSTNPTYRVNLSHGLTHASETTYRTINYLTKGTTTPVHPSDIQPLAWDIITDKVTGATISVPKGGYEALTAPLVSGYVAETSSVDGQYPGVVIGKYNDKSAITIYYTPNSEKTGIPGNDGSPLVTPPTTPKTVTPQNGGGTVVTPPTTTPAGDNGTTPSEPEGDTANNHDKTPNQPSDDHNQTPSQDNGEAVTTDTEKGKAHDAGQMSQVTLAQSSAKAQSAVGTVQQISKNNGNNTLLNTASAKLPQTNEQRSNTWTIMGLFLMSILSLFGIGKQRKHESN